MEAHVKWVLSHLEIQKQRPSTKVAKVSLLDARVSSIV